MTMHRLKPIRTEADHERAMARIDELWGSPTGTPMGDELKALEAVELKLFCMLFCRNRFFRLGFRRFVLCLGIPVP